MDDGLSSAGFTVKISHLLVRLKAVIRYAKQSASGLCGAGEGPWDPCSKLLPRERRLGYWEACPALQAAMLMQLRQAGRFLRCGK